MPKMSKKAFLELLAQLGETQDQQADALGVHRRSIIRWTKHGDNVPAVVRRLLLTIEAYGPVDWKRDMPKRRGW